MNNLTQQCHLQHSSFNFSEGIKYCESVYDSVLCWGPTEAGTNITMHCPSERGLDPTKFAWRTCQEDGRWWNNNRTDLGNKGYTNYDECIRPLLWKLLKICHGMSLDECMKIMGITREIEMVGLCLSLITLIMSLIIFSRYRILRNNRTTIHKNLFVATMIQVIVRLVIYVDQIYKSPLEHVGYICETCVVLLEFSKIATIMWMFIEGLYLHNAITVTVFQEHSYIKIYCYVGWMVPKMLTLIWIITMVNTETDKCWYLYNLLPNYWILEGPSSALIVINIIFLLNIIRILVVKLRESSMGEIQQVRKAVRAAVFLVPLMGTTNILFMIDHKLLNNQWKLAMWSYTTHFFISFQGFFIATLYCFLNGEVRDVVRNSLSIYMSLRHDNTQRRTSTEEGLSTLKTQQ